MKFGFIGAGKVGFSLGKYLADNNQNVVGYYSIINEEAIEAAKFTGSKYYENMEQLVEDSEVLFLTVPDGQIENLWNQLKSSHKNWMAKYNKPLLNNKIVCHCSGALSSDIFSSIAEYESFGYSIHPLFAVSNRYESYKELSDSYFTIEGNIEKINKMKELFESFGNTVCIISKDDKIKYHGAAAIASNLVVGLIGLSEELLKHIVEEGVVEALTGPIERCDVSTVRKHMSVFDKKTNEIYKAVSKEVLEIAKIKNKDRDYSKMEEVLQ